MMRDRPIVITESDARVLRSLLATRVEDRDQEHIEELRAELERAQVVASNEAPEDVVTLHRAIEVLDLGSGEQQKVILVSPAKANVRAHCISVLAPLGTALLGNRVGDEVEWLMPGGLRRLRVERVDARLSMDGAWPMQAVAAH
jgi:regulator of nucleoside diphosphate kinase